MNLRKHYDEVSTELARQVQHFVIELQRCTDQQP